MRIFISGYGKMGKMIEEIIKAQNLPYAGASDDLQKDYTADLKDCVCIDFSQPQAFRENYKFIAENFSALVLGTTGWEDIREEVFEYFKKHDCCLIWASNFSVGMNAFMAINKKLAEILAPLKQYSSYIVEKHHVHKLDAPSGTAKSLAELISPSIPVSEIHSIRIGEIKGEHTVVFEGEDDRIVLEHEAFSRRAFAQGAVLAALKAAELKGVYNFAEILE